MTWLVALLIAALLGAAVGGGLRALRASGRIDDETTVRASRPSVTRVPAAEAADPGSHDLHDAA